MGVSYIFFYIFLLLLTPIQGALPTPVSGKKVALFGALAIDATSTVGSYVLSGANVTTVSDALARVGAHVQYVLHLISLSTRRGVGELTPAILSLAVR